MCFEMELEGFRLFTGCHSSLDIFLSFTQISGSQHRKAGVFVISIAYLTLIDREQIILRPF